MTFFLMGLLIAVLIPQAWAPVLLVGVIGLPLIALGPALRRVGWLAAGLIIALVGQALILAHQPPVDLSVPVQVTGTVIGLPEHSGERQQFLFQPEQLTGLAWTLPRRIRVSVYDQGPRVAAGERWRIWLKLRRPRGFINPVRFNYAQWLASEQIDATAYRVQPDQAERLAPAAGIHHWRSQLTQRIEALVWRDGPGEALLQGLITGDRRGFTDRIWQVLRATGTSHLMAISGLHIGLVAGFGFYAGRKLAGLGVLPGSPHIMATTLGAIFAVIYAALAGFALPTQRALVMGAVMGLAYFSQRRLASGRALSLAAILLVGLDPASALAPGFWLSFSAVALIIAVMRRPSRGLLGGLVRIQAVLVIGLAPLSALFFGTWSPLGLGVNLLVLPLFSFVVVPAALGAAMLSLISTAFAGMLLNQLAGLLNALIRGGEWLVSLGLGAERLEISHSGVLIATALAIALWLLPRGVPMRGLAGIMLIPLFAGASARLPPGDFTVTWLEVGQGSAAVIETAHHTVVVDTGPAWGAGSAADYTLVPFLEQRGIQAIDRLVVTHADQDHRGGVGALQKALPIHAASVGEPIAALPEAVPCQAGQQWRFDQVLLEVLWPIPGQFARSNNRSCVLALSNEHTRIVLTGDIERGAEAVLASLVNQSADVMSAPHHGSRSSSTAAILDAFKPRQVVISAGYRNAYAMPHRSVLARYVARGIKVRDVGLSGAVTARVQADQPIHWQTARRQHGRLVNAPPNQGRFQDGREIHYDLRSCFPSRSETGQPLCGN